MFKRLLLTINILLMFAICSTAQTIETPSFKNIFVQIPDSLLPILSKVNREDLVDFKTNNMKAVVNNRLGGDTELVTLDDGYLSLKLTESTDLEMKLLFYQNKLIVGVIKTVKAPLADSFIRFYNLNWQEITDSISFPSITIDKFIVESELLKASEEIQMSLRSAIRIFLKSYHFNPTSTNITVELTSLEDFTKEEKEALSKFFRPQLTLIWTDNGYHFKG